MSNSAVNNNEIPFGTIIDSRYLIQKVLGQGGLGRTYLALDTHRFNEPCVLKEFAPLGSGQYDLEKSRNLFKREAKILHQITHPQIPKFLACFEGKNRLFLVQEYVKGQTYSQLLQERQQQGRVFSELEVSRWLLNMLPILSYIHQRGIIHRDISPDNIMQPQAKELPVLIDFGVGKLTNLSYSETEQLSNNHHNSFVGKMSFVGKIGYAPREQISMGRCSPSSDLYPLGVTAIVLLTGKMPTLLLDQYSLEWKWRRYAQTSREFAQIIDRMIEDRPRQRYQSSEEVIAHLQELKHEREDTLTPELAEITDAHFYQKISLFSEKQNNQTTKKSKSNSLTSNNQETIINPSFSSKNSNRSLQSDRLLDSTSKPNPTEPSKIKSAPKNQEYWSDSSPSSMEETIAVNTSIELNDRKHKTYQDSHSRASTHQNSSSPRVNFSNASPPSQQKLSSSSPVYPETLRQPSLNSENHSIKRQDLLGSMTHPVGNNPQANKYRRITEQFITRCQKELAYLIGPMASLIVEETLLQNTSLSPEQLVELLAENIPDTQQEIKFKQKLLS